MNMNKALTAVATHGIDRTFTVFYSMGGLTNSVVIRAENAPTAKTGVEELMGCVVTYVREKL